MCIGSWNATACPPFQACHTVLLMSRLKRKEGHVKFHNSWFQNFCSSFLGHHCFYTRFMMCIKTRCVKTRWDGHGSVPGRFKTFPSFRQRLNRLWGPPSFLSNGHGGCFLGCKSTGALSWPLKLLPWSKMHGAMPSLPPYICMVWCLSTGTAWPLPILN